MKSKFATPPNKKEPWNWTLKHVSYSIGSRNIQTDELNLHFPFKNVAFVCPSCFTHVHSTKKHVWGRKRQVDGANPVEIYARKLDQLPQAMVKHVKTSKGFTGLGETLNTNTVPSNAHFWRFPEDTTSVVSIYLPIMLARKKKTTIPQPPSPCFISKHRRLCSPGMMNKASPRAVDFLIFFHAKRWLPPPVRRDVQVIRIFIRNRQKCPATYLLNSAVWYEVWMTKFRFTKI